MAWSPVRSEYPAEDETQTRIGRSPTPRRHSRKAAARHADITNGRSPPRKLNLRDGLLAAQTRTRRYRAQVCPPCPGSPSDKETNANDRHNTRVACADLGWVRVRPDQRQPARACGNGSCECDPVAVCAPDQAETFQIWPLFGACISAIGAFWLKPTSVGAIVSKMASADKVIRGRARPLPPL